MIGRMPMHSSDELAGWDFRERSTSILPVERKGRVQLTGTSELQLPFIVSGPIGPARRFSEGQGLRAGVGREFVSAADVSVVALLDLRGTPSRPRGTLIRCGEDSAVAWSFQLETLGGGMVRVGLHYTAGNASVGLSAIIGISIGWHLWTLSRVRVRQGLAFRVAIDGQLRAETIAADVPIAAPVSPVLSLGYADGAAELEPVRADVAALRVFGREVSLAESRSMWLGLTEDPDRAHALAVGVEPVHLDGGGVWSTDESSRVRRELHVDADIASVTLGQLRAVLDELPDRAYGDALARWERLLGVSGEGPCDIEDRRRRVLAELARVQAFTAAEYAEVFGPVLDGQVEVLEASNRYEFGPFEGEPRQWVNVGGVGYAGGQARVVAASTGTYPYPHRPVGVRQDVSTDGEGYRATVLASVAQWPASAAASAGILFEGHRGRAVFFGREGGQVVWLEWAGTTWVELAAAPVGDEVEVIGAQHLGAGVFRGWLAESFGARPAGVDIETEIVRPRKVWLVMMTRGEPTPAATTWAIDRAAMHFPDGLELYTWHLYRDGDAPGDPDIEGAERLLQRTKPAHTEAHATLRDAMYLGDSLARLGRSPLR
ncbi:MAG: hypothetical protein AAGC55_04710 [Myxococcota bacterium]